MNKLIFLAAATALIAQDALAQRSGQSMTVQTGVVVAARSVDLQSEAGRGALVGGVAGYALTSSSRSSSRRARNTVLGAAVGGRQASRAQGSRDGMQYTVEIAPGNQVTIVTEQTQVRIGDCVTVEQSGSSANIRRVADSLCEAAANNEIDEEIQSYMVAEADRCQEAKDRLMDAETDEAFDIAMRRVEFLCND